MGIRQLLGTIRRRTIAALERRELPLTLDSPVISFTFDDFPRSALLMGGTVLKSYGANGTYYVAMGLMNKKNDLGEQFRAEDLGALLEAGHELGSHSFSHVSCRSRRLQDYQADVLQGRAAVEQVTGILDVHHFSYPYGHVTLGAKRLIGNSFSSCRGIVPGINESPVDLSLLRANSLYSQAFDLDSVDRLLKENQRRRGWVIFYTHDVSENPSPFGCRPGQLEKVVQLAASRG